MSEKHVAKHRSAPTAPLHARLRRDLARVTGRRLRSIGLSSVAAVVATGLAVSTGVLTQAAAPLDGAAAVLSSAPGEGSGGGLTQDELDEREERASRSTGDRRPAADQAKARTLSGDSGVAVTKKEDLSDADPKTVARALMPQYGISSAEFDCLDNIWTQESGWNVHADNPTSSAYGIPQALPGSKMSSAGPDWENDAETQIRWGLGYIKARYGTACSAWSFKQGAGWY